MRGRRTRMHIWEIRCAGRYVSASPSCCCVCAERLDGRRLCSWCYLIVGLCSVLMVSNCCWQYCSCIMTALTEKTPRPQVHAPMKMREQQPRAKARLLGMTAHTPSANNCIFVNATHESSKLAVWSSLLLSAEHARLSTAQNHQNRPANNVM